MQGIADIGAAVIGTGFIGTVHVEALRRIGVAGPRRARQHARSAARLGPRRSASRAPTRRSTTLLDDPTVDVVHVTSPNDLHLPQAKAVLAAGRHVICEKPLAMSAAESRELVDLAAATGLVNAANFNIRYYPLNQHAHEVVTGGRDGRRAARHRPLLPGLAAARDATGTGASSRNAAARCAPSATSGRTGST